MADADEESAVKVYARVRQIMPWEAEKLGIKWTDKTITNYGVANASKEYKFTKILAPEMDNDEVFETVIRPLISRVLDGYNSLVIAYGQTGAGKTYTLLGKPKLGVTGMLTRSLVEFLENPDVKEIKLRAMEAYGVKPQRIDLYDLLDEKNHTGNWKAKFGNSRFQIESKETNTYTIKTKQDCFDVIQRAQQSSHFAPTGKNPESSRGHIVFVIDVKGENSRNEEISSSMVFADLAGSEGDSALTDEFIASVSEETLLARKLEGGVINVGLSELQLVFRDLMKKGTLSKSTGTGLIRMIKPYINSNTFISVCFCLSPSFVNCASSEATLKFAAQACQLRTAPAKAERKINYENMANRLKEELTEQQELVMKLQALIASALTNAAEDLLDKVKQAGMMDMFDIDEEEVKQSRKKGKHQRKVTARLSRNQSAAMLAIDAAEADEQTWHVSRTNRKHRRMFSKHIDANQVQELAAEPLSAAFQVERGDEIMVADLFAEAEEDENTRSWLGVMAQSLYRTRVGVGNRMSAWGGRVEAFFSRVAAKLFGRKRKSREQDAGESSSEVIVRNGVPHFSGGGSARKNAIGDYTDSESFEEPEDNAGGHLQDTHSVSLKGMPSKDTIRSMQFDKMDSEGNIALDLDGFHSLGGNPDKKLLSINTEDVIRLDARE